jgi:RNA polymerase sigma-70 factor (ECF subfamily)
VGFSDAELIGRVLDSGDPNAFAELVRRYQSPVRAFLRRMTRGDAALADDLAQGTFVRAWRKLETCRDHARFSSWLFGIAFNQFRASARQRSRLGEAALDEATPESTPTQDPAPHGLRLDLNEALSRLTTAERAAIVLCCQNGLTHEEAAVVLDIPLGTIKTNVLRGKEKLRRWLRL